MNCPVLAVQKQANSLEHRRARELDQLLGPKRSATPRADFVIDLHNTTAETGVALMIAPTDEFAHEVAHYLTLLDASVVVRGRPPRPGRPAGCSMGLPGVDRWPGSRIEQPHGEFFAR